MANKNGLLAPQATHGNPEVSYYALKNNGTLVAPTLISPVTIQNADTLLEPPVISSVGENHPLSAYVGALALRPGGNDDSAIGAAGVVIRATTGPATVVEVGTDSEGPNLLLIAGADGTGQVYDEVYNQPVSLKPITKTTVNPVLTPANPEEVLRGGQAAVAAAIAAPGTIFNIFQVPRTGAYMVQTEIALGNATASNTVVIPSTVVDGVPIWKSISLNFQIQGTVTPVPYASFEVIGGDFYADQAFAGNSLVTKTYTSVAILQAGTNYAITLNAEAGWNIGDAGQIKTELIAMC